MQVNLIKEIKQWLLKSHEVEYNITVKRCDFVFSASQGSAETLFRRGGKINYSLLA